MVIDMYFQDIGATIRQARLANKLTQENLAVQAEVSRGTINQLEAGVYPDLGAKKLLTILKVLGLDLSIRKTRKVKPAEPDYLELACISANVSYKEPMTPDVLAQTLLTGKVPPKLRPNLRVVYDEVPPQVFAGMVRQVSRWGSRPERVVRHVREIGEAIGCTRKLAV
jgi:transcriptional regulator with XRE-family HTH domain